MAFDQHKNLAVSTITQAPSPPTTGNSVIVSAGEGVRFPAWPFNATIWPANTMPTPANAEIVRVTGQSGDILQIVRAQEGTTASGIGAGDLIAASITARTLTDLETQAALLAAPNQFTGTPQQIGPVPAAALTLHDSGAPVDARVFRIMDSAQILLVSALNDAQTTEAARPLILNRFGDAAIGRDVLEKGRATAMGHVINVPFNAGFCTAAPGTWVPASFTYNYALVGRTLHLGFSTINANTTGSPTTLRLTLPAGFTAAVTMGGSAMINPTGGAWVAGIAWVDAGLTYINIAQSGQAAFTSGLGLVYLAMSIFI